MPIITHSHYIPNINTYFTILGRVSAIEGDLLLNGFNRYGESNLFFNRLAHIYVTKSNYHVIARETLAELHTAYNHDYLSLIGYLTINHLMPSSYRDSLFDPEGDSSHIDNNIIGPPDQYEF